MQTKPGPLSQICMPSAPWFSQVKTKANTFNKVPLPIIKGHRTALADRKLAQHTCRPASK